MTDIDASREAVERLANTCCSTGSNYMTSVDAPKTLRALLARAEAAEAREKALKDNSEVARTLQRRCNHLSDRLKDANSERDILKAEAERLREVCWSLFHLGNGGHSLKDASWTGAKWIDGGELQEVWEEASAALQENQDD